MPASPFIFQGCAQITEEIDASGEILLADGGASGDGAAEQQSASDPVKGAIEKTYVDTLGRRMKKVHHDRLSSLLQTEDKK
jgi:hypothetical protein